LSEINQRVEVDERCLVTVMTIKFAEEVSDYLQRMGVKAHYLHSEIDTIERSEIIKALRLGHIDVIVGINLLREGLDIPEVSLVAIFDADKEGFLRNERSLLQTIGRASRNENGQVILYADRVSIAMESAITQTIERRERQMLHNELNGIVPKTIQKALPVMGIEADQLLAGTAGKGVGGGKRLVGRGGGGVTPKPDLVKDFDLGSAPNVGQPVWADVAHQVLEGDTLQRLKKEMNTAAARLEFERAAALRDRIFQLENESSN
jgi:excinuclease ABC subunit B